MLSSKITTKKLVIFSILMQNNQGILGKSPDYIREKWESVNKMEHPDNLLDSVNTNTYHQYINRWMIDKDKRHDK